MYLLRAAALSALWATSPARGGEPYALADAGLAGRGGRRVVVVLTPGFSVTGYGTLVSALEARGLDAWTLGFPEGALDPARIVQEWIPEAVGEHALIGHGGGGTLAAMSVAGGHARPSALALLGAPLRSLPVQGTGGLAALEVPLEGIDPNAYLDALRPFLGATPPPLERMGQAWVETVQGWARGGLDISLHDAPCPVWAGASGLDNVAPPEAVRPRVAPASFVRFGFARLDTKEPDHARMLSDVGPARAAAAWLARQGPPGTVVPEAAPTPTPTLTSSPIVARVSQGSDGSPAPAHRALPSPQPGASAGAIGALVETADGAAIYLHRYPTDGPPVILVHGISSNRYAWDLTEERSLARVLHARGYDTWLLDLRGHGGAKRDLDGRPQRAGWTMDDYGRYDLPAAFAHIQRETGHDRVAYVGHSMGGMVAAIYQALYGDAVFGALVVVGSPVDFGSPDPLLSAGKVAAILARPLPRLHTPAMARAAGALPSVPFADAMLFNSDNLAHEARALMYDHIVSPLSRGELRQLTAMLATGRFLGADGTTDYFEALARFTAPLLVLAGRADRIAPADRVLPWVERVASEDKQFVLAGRANGFAHDYGHLDLTLGDAAPTEIYPIITDFLKQRW